MWKHRHQTLAAVVALACHGLSGCGTSDGTSGAGGIDTERLPSKVPAEVFRLGGLDAPEEEVFTRPPPLAVGPDGSLLALERSANEVRRFAPDGTFLNAIGGRGEGPGEFSVAWSEGFVGDTVWVRNLMPVFVSFFTMEGEYVRTDRPSELILARGGIPRGPAAMLKGGSSLVVEVVRFGEERGRVEVPLMIVPAGEAPIDTIGTVLDPPAFYLPGVGTVGGLPYPPPSYYDAFPLGEGVVVAEWGGPGTPDGSVEIRRYSSGGSLQSADTFPFLPTVLDREVEDSIVGAVADTVRAALARVREMLVSDPPEAPSNLPDLIREQAGLGSGYLPPIRSVLAGLDGTVWLEHLIGPSTTEWVCIDLEAEPLFRVTLPPGETLRAARKDAIWTTWTDSLDVPYVSRHDLIDSR